MYKCTYTHTHVHTRTHALNTNLDKLPPRAAQYSVHVYDHSSNSARAQLTLAPFLHFLPITKKEQSVRGRKLSPGGDSASEGDLAK